MGTKKRFTPANSCLRLSSDGSMTTEDFWLQSRFETSMKPNRSEEPTLFAYNSSTRP